MAHETQKYSLAYSLGRVYEVYTDASEISLTAAASTMFLITNFLIALSFGQALEQLVQRMYLTCPRPCLLRPPFLRLKVIFSCRSESSNIPTSVLVAPSVLVA